MVAETIAVANGLAQAWVLGRKMRSKKWKKELKSHVNYVHVVEQKVKSYKNSMNSRCRDCKSSMPAVLTLLEEKLKESECIRLQWKNKNNLFKPFTSNEFINELHRSEDTIHNHLELLPDCRCQEGNHAVQQKLPPKGRKGKGRSQRSRRQREKEREETEYRAWLRKNVTKRKDSWTRYSKRATNSKLDSAKKEILFRKHMEGLREKYQQYRQLLKEFIKPESKDKYLTLWSAAEHLLQGHRRFDRFPERERKGEWSKHVKQISEKRHKTK